MDVITFGKSQASSVNLIPVFVLRKANQLLAVVSHFNGQI